MRSFARSLRRTVGYIAATLTVSGALVAGAAAPAAANHVAAMTVTQAGASGAYATLQVDLTMSGASGGASFGWDTGDSRSGWISDGVVNGAYAGDASGTGSFSTGNGALGSFTWQRTQPAAGLVRTRITYPYSVAGTYTVTWDDCCPDVRGTTPVTVTGSLATCSDGVDNDGDGNVDYPADAGCAGPDDSSEFADCPLTTTGVRLCLVPGTKLLDVAVRSVDVAPIGPNHRAVGYVEAYRFIVGGVPLSVPCVRLLAENQGVNPCALAGGTFVETVSELELLNQNEPQPTWGPVIAGVGVCKAELVAKVGPFGTDGAPALTLCQAGSVAV